MRVDWSKRVVFITGASSGIGRGLATAMGKKGASLGLLARRSDALKELVAEVKEAGGCALALPGDVRNADSVRLRAIELSEAFGPIDVMVANAGVAATTAAKDLKAEAVAEVINTNVIGAVNSATAVIPEMVERQQGQLVVISSLAAYRGLPKSAAYCASKAAVSAFFESLRVDLRGTGVDVTIIHPGFIKTPLTEGRQKEMPYLMELDVAVEKILRAIETRKKSYAFPWQLASIVRAAMIMPVPLYDRIVAKRSYRE